MAKAFDVTTREEYILMDDRQLPESEQTVWTLGPLTHKQDTEVRQRYSEQIIKDGETVVKVDPRLTSAFAKYGIKGIRNFTDSAGREIPFRTGKDGGLADDILAQIRPQHLDEIGFHVFSMSRATPEELGN